MFLTASLFLLLISLAAGLTVLVMSGIEYVRSRDPRVLATIVYILFINIMHVSAFYALSLYGVVFDFGRIDNTVLAINIIVRGSALFVLPFFIQQHCPFRRLRAMPWIFLVISAVFIAAIWAGIIPAGKDQTMAIFALMFLPAFYTSAVGFVAFRRIPPSLFKGSKDEACAFASAGVFILLVPFYVTVDFILIPMGVLPDSYQMFPFLSLLTDIGFLIIAMGQRKWIPYDTLMVVLNDRKIPEAEAPLFQNYGLSRREGEIARLLSEGLSYKEMGERLGISQSTVKTHVLKVYDKMGINRRADIPKFDSQ